MTLEPHPPTGTTEKVYWNPSIMGPMQDLPGRRVIDAANRPVGVLLAKRVSPSGAVLHEILLCPPEGLETAFDPEGLERAARAAAGSRGRFARAVSRLEILELAEDRFGHGLDEEELLFLLAYDARVAIPFERALATLLAGPEDIDERPEGYRLKAPWRDFLVEASQELPEGVTGIFTAGLVEGWTTVEVAPRGGGAADVTRFSILAPSEVEVEFQGHLPVQEGDHVLVRGALHGGTGWRIKASATIVPSRKVHYEARPDGAKA